jgi:hypothetical protein
MLANNLDRYGNNPASWIAWALETLQWLSVPPILAFSLDRCRDTSSLCGFEQIVLHEYPTYL